MTSVYDKDGIELGNKIAKAVLSEYDTVTRNLKSGTPITRSNGVTEWTILASIVLIQDDEVIRVMTLTSGMKAIPVEKLKQSGGGMVLHDLHAEILSLRAFNEIIISEIRQLKKKKSSFLLQKPDDDEGKIQFHPNLKFALYVSDAPCGDASMELIDDGNGESWTKKRDNEGNMIKFLRGRSFYRDVGKVRTKPGRTDSLVSLSKSCSDKLTAKNHHGYSSSIVAYLGMKDFKLDYLVIPRCKVNETALNRCFKERIGTLSCPFKVIPTECVFKFEKKSDPNCKPSDLSLVALTFSSDDDAKWEVEIVGKNGILNGRNIKKLGLKDVSRLCNAKLCANYKDLLSDADAIKNYSDLKSSQPQREKDKKFIRESVLKDEWVYNYRDDFVI